MDTNNLMKIIITAVIGVVLFSAVLVPIIGTATYSAADVENYENESTLLSLAEATDTVTVSLASSTITLNGETVSPSTNGNMILSDVISFDVYYYNGDWLYRVWVENGTALLYPSAFTLTFADGTVTGSYTISSTSYTVNDTYSYLFYADTSGDYVQIDGSTSGWSAYINNDEDVVLSGLYYTGSNDTTYSYIDGVMSTYGDYESSVAITKTLVDGTLDVYKMTGCVVTVGDETFTPFRIIVPAEITGHMENELTPLISIIPMLVLVGLVLGVVGAVIARRD